MECQYVRKGRGWVEELEEEDEEKEEGEEGGEGGGVRRRRSLKEEE